MAKWDFMWPPSDLPWANVLEHSLHLCFSSILRERERGRLEVLVSLSDGETCTKLCVWRFEKLKGVGDKYSSTKRHTLPHHYITTIFLFSIVTQYFILVFSRVSHLRVKCYF